MPGQKPESVLARLRPFAFPFEYSPEEHVRARHQMSLLMGSKKVIGRYFQACYEFTGVLNVRVAMHTNQTYKVY